MSSGQPRNITTTSQQRAEPFAVAAPLFPELYETAAGAMRQSRNPFTGDIVATSGPDFASGINMLRAAAQPGGPIGAGASDVLNMATATARGDYLRPETNPFLASATAPIIRQFNESVLPAISDQAIAEGAYGGSGHGIAKGRAAEGLAGTLAQFYADNYARERGIQLQAPALLGAAYDLTNAPGTQMLSIADMQRTESQRAIDNALAKFQEVNRTAPWYGLGDLTQILTAGGFGTTSGTQTAPNPNYVDPMTNILKTLIGGAAGVAAIGGSGGFGLWGPAAAGAAMRR